MIIVDEKYESLFKKDYKDILDSKIIKNKDIMVGNYILNIFNINLDLNLEDYEIFSINDNYENSLNDIIKDYSIAYYNNNIYVNKKFKEILDTLLLNNYSEEYNIYLLKSTITSNNIFDSIKKLELNKTIELAKTQSNIIKKIDNKNMYPINYCNYLIGKTFNKLAIQILKEIFNVLKTYKYEIPPSFLDIDNFDIYGYEFGDFKNKYDIINYLYFKDISIFYKYISIFKIDYTDDDFMIFLNLNRNESDTIINCLIDKNIYTKEVTLELLLILNKVNKFAEIYNHHKIDFISIKNKFSKTFSLLFELILD